MHTNTGPTLAATHAELVGEFAGVFSSQTVEQILEDSYARLLPASIEGFLPLLAERFARERLRAASRAMPGREALRPLVLFVCTANSGRSQMAAALLAQRSAGAVEVASAGTRPGDHVQDEVTTVLAEVGVSTSELFPKPLTDEVVSGADVVVTMGCGDSCPVLPGRRYVDWDVADPVGADLDVVRRVRDDIDAHIASLLDELLPDRGAKAASAQL
ncbi:low molecular weight phosphatase family protein [Nocardioides sp. zg-DK7169]|uniref:arsenate-mycothiol transferase ArsC n=1 Tax=Nocardioides sp. zg-DK7169 TaxID=2736600 RepID=UPI001552CB3C|nr:arsenate reductase ArsC [Nocardioides sp. zg-DK7169]NPC96031.1 arsenate reductase ArsC [Nocardioides sp. zg-DK7169]